MTRRLLIAAALVGASLAPSLASAQAQRPAQNVVILIGNGLGPTVTTAARALRFRDEGRLFVDTMPRVARVRTYAIDAMSTDSTAAVSAMLTGVKVRNDVVAMDGDTRAAGYAPARDPIRGVANAENHCPATGNGGASQTLLEVAIARDKGSGLVTTGRLTAGPAAAAYAHVCHRAAEYEVARQAVPKGAGYNAALGKGVDVLLGGGSAPWRPFDAGKRSRGRPDGRELIGELQTLGYTFVTDLTAMDAAPFVAGSRLLGLFDFVDDQSAMSYDLDRDPKREPSLAAMTSKAIDVLSTHPEGFVLIVEAARIDDALHAGNARRALVDALAFDDAVRITLEKVDLDKTLVIAVGDHDSTMALIGGGRRGGDVLGLHLNAVTGKPDLDSGGAPYTSLLFGSGVNRPDRRAAIDSPTVLQKDYQQESAVRVAAGTNGGGDVVLWASGRGSENFRGTIDNTRVFGLVRRAMGL